MIDAWIPYTKLHPPHLRPDLLPRKRIIRLLDTAVQKNPLTLISAPAGYGKTTLVTSWLDQAANEPAAAWLSLDTGDDEPAIFMMALTAALQQVNPSFTKSLEKAQSGQAAPNLSLTRQMGLLINGIGANLDQRLLLILDDLHTIAAPEILEALDYLLQHLPGRMRMLILTRVDPDLRLAQLRARGRLAELRPPDLRFTLTETEALLNGVFELGLEEEALRDLHTHVAGWISGIRLLANRNPRSVRSAQRPAARGEPHLFDLLAEEVFRQQPAAIQDFLLATAVLDELTPDLCTAVTDNPAAPQLLTEIYRRNLFLTTQTDGDVASYRYHDLFARFLRHHLALTRPEMAPALHRRAGDAEPNPGRAIRHYLTAEAYEQAALRIEQVAEQIFNRGLFNRLQEWILALPDAVRDRRPWLNFYLGVAQWGRSRHRDAQQHLEAALAAFTEQADEVGRGETLVQLSIVYQTQGNFAPAAQCSSAALDLPISARSRCQSEMALAWLALAEGAPAQSGAHLAQAFTLAETSAEDGPLNICMMQTRFPFQCVPAARSPFARLADLLDRRDPAPLTPQRAALHGAQMFTHFLAGDLASMTSAGEAARRISQELGGLTWLMTDTAVLLAIAYALRGDKRSFLAQMEQNRPLTELFTGWRRTFLFMYGYACWTLDLTGEMGALFDRMHTPLPHEWPSAKVLFSAMQGMVAMEAADWSAAETHLLEALHLQQQIPVATNFSDARLLLAILHARRNEPARAVDYLRAVLDQRVPQDRAGLVLLAGRPLLPVLAWAEEQGIHAAVCRQLRGELMEERPSFSLHIPQTQSTLTPREVEVLRLLVEGASNKDIAAELVISIPTVKTHVSRILSKLDVKSRTEAAARTREFDLLL